MKWEILNKKAAVDIKSIVNILLKNRGIRGEEDKKIFFNPEDPMKISMEDLGIDTLSLKKAIKRIKEAKEKKEHVIIYGDYDADGITGTATIWETLHNLGIFVLPHIPERFTEGYGLNLKSVEKLKKEDPEISLVITVDHGITAGEKIEKIKKMGIDMIITDHHQKSDKLPNPLALIYTTMVSGSALAWFFSREIVKKLDPSPKNDSLIEDQTELAAIGTIADQLPLIGPNRSMVRFGLERLNKTKRPGLVALFKEAGISEIGTYEVGFVIAPRINSMGRLRHGLESLRLLCTKDKIKGLRLAGSISEVNLERQNIVDEVMAHALKMPEEELSEKKVIVLASEKYNEGVIGLAAAKLVEKFYRPAIVMSVKGDIAKASARSIAGFNIIETIRKLDKFYLEGGGHPMAAGFSIETKNIILFTEEINKIAKEILNDDLLQKRIKIDCEIDFGLVDNSLIEKISDFAPTGLENPEPVFVTHEVEVLDVKPVGKDSKHLKLKLRQNEHILDSIFFGGGKMYPSLSQGKKINIVYSIEENIWNGYKNIQLKIKDLESYPN